MSGMASVDHDKRDQAQDQLSDVVDQLKPRLRGWLHAGMTPLAIAAGVVLVSLAPTRMGTLGAAVFLAASVMLYGTSGLYHRFSWGTRGEAVLRRLDHANIYVFIAATYTPFALLMLHGTSRVLLLGLIWGSALAGLMFRLFWLSAPRWLYTLLYLAMGWAAVGWMKEFYRAGGTAVLLLILAGGLLYSLGAVVYGLKRPNPSPRWFGFHEIFHACTIAAFVLHYVAISLVTYRAG
ncbi:MAG: hemolysin III family protein [Propionibacteriaceae bacterium]|nr:hemolysin III family protein [Propionibacteriaceae bacterium]